MTIFEFDVSKPLKYHLTGKFEAPSIDWMHDDMPTNEYELIIMTEGVLYLSYDNINYTVKKGEMLLLPPFSSFHNHRKGFKRAYSSFYWMHFCAPDSKKVIVPNQEHSCYPYRLEANHIALPMQAQLRNTDKTIVHMKQLQDSIRNHYDEITINYIVTSILCEIHSQFYWEYNADKCANAKAKQIYYDINDYVKLNYNQNLKISEIALHFGYNEKYISYLFNSFSGMPLKKFIMNVKIDAANYLLSDTNDSIAEIASSLGFTDSHNFSTMYKKVVGMTPSEYRNAFSKRLLYHK